MKEHSVDKQGSGEGRGKGPPGGAGAAAPRKRLAQQIERSASGSSVVCGGEAKKASRGARGEINATDEDEALTCFTDDSADWEVREEEEPPDEAGLTGAPAPAGAPRKRASHAIERGGSGRSIVSGGAPKKASCGPRGDGGGGAKDGSWAARRSSCPSLIQARRDSGCAPAASAHACFTDDPSDDEGGAPDPAASREFARLLAQFSDTGPRASAAPDPDVEPESAGPQSGGSSLATVPRAAPMEPPRTLEGLQKSISDLQGTLNGRHIYGAYCWGPQDTADVEELVAQLEEMQEDLRAQGGMFANFDAMAQTFGAMRDRYEGLRLTYTDMSSFRIALPQRAASAGVVEWREQGLFKSVEGQEDCLEAQRARAAQDLPLVVRQEEARAHFEELWEEQARDEKRRASNAQELRRVLALMRAHVTRMWEHKLD